MHAIPRPEHHQRAPIVHAGPLRETKKLGIMPNDVEQKKAGLLHRKYFTGRITQYEIANGAVDLQLRRAYRLP